MAFNHPLTVEQERELAKYQHQIFLIETKTTLFHARLERRARFEDPVCNLPWEASIDYYGNIGQPPYDEQLDRLSDEEAAAKLDRLYAEHSNAAWLANAKTELEKLKTLAFMIEHDHERVRASFVPPEVLAAAPLVPPPAPLPPPEPDPTEKVADT